MSRRYYTIDGDAYVTKYDSDFARIEPVVEDHYYENRVAATNSVLNYRKITDQEAAKEGAFSYPPVKDNHKQQVILGVNDSPDAERLLENVNGYLGKSKQAKLFVLVWKNKPISILGLQEAYWKNANKNELVVCVSIDDAGKPQWAGVISWTPSQELKIEVRNFLMSQDKLDLVAFANWIKPEMDAKWKRKHFRDYHYLTVDPPLWAVITTFLLTVLSSGGIGAWAFLNAFDNEILLATKVTNTKKSNYSW